jgi:hypothetical protein
MAGVAAVAFWGFVWLVWLNLQARAYVTHIHDRGPLATSSLPTPASHIEPRLSRIARELAGRDVEVRCWSPSDWYRLDSERAEIDDDTASHGLRSAFVSYDRKRIDMGTIVCAELAQTLDGADRLERADLAWAVKLLAHESMHVRGVENEATAECYGMQAIPRTASLLGLGGDEGRRLADFYWSGWYPRMDPEYRSEECRDGGELDLRPESGIWP